MNKTKRRALLSDEMELSSRTESSVVQRTELPQGTCRDGKQGLLFTGRKKNTKKADKVKQLV